MERKLCMCLQAQNRMVRMMLNDAKMLSDVTQNRRYAAFVCGELAQHYAVNAV